MPAISRRKVPPVNFFNDWKTEVGEGWGGILDDLNKELHNVTLPKGFHVLQVKEKFGILRVHVAPVGDDDVITHLIRQAELRSAKVCERCGAAGEAVCPRYHLKTYCAPHAEEYAAHTPWRGH